MLAIRCADASSGDESKARRRHAGRRVHHLCGASVCGSRVRHLRTIKDVRELHADAQRAPLLDMEQPAQRKVFVGATLKPIIGIVGGSRAQLTRCGLRPRVLIQHEYLVGIEAMAVQVLRKQRLARNAIRIAGVASGVVTKQHGIEVVLCLGRQNRETLFVCNVGKV